MKNTYIAAVTTENEKHYAYIIKIPGNANAWHILKDHNKHNSLHIAHICETRKQAREVVQQWNEAYKSNGSYMFDDGPLF